MNMKKILKYSIALLFAVAMTSCYDGIDPITAVDPGADVTAPVVKIIAPVEGSTIKVYEEVTSFDVKIEVTDDIEIASISILLDGSEIKSFSSFIDYRRALEQFTYNNLVDGDHVLTVKATDIEGKSTSSEVNFSKEPPYIPLFDGEVLYMPFDGDYRDLISFNIANQVGTPGFAGEGYAGPNAYKGATDSYLTFPSGGLQSNEFSAAFWYKVSGSPDRSGILVAGADQNRTQGFRLFREGSGTEQRIKLNVGTGTGESWNDGGVIDVTAGEWVHVAVTISQTESKIYFDGIEMNTAAMSGPIDWTGVGQLTIESGGPTFSYWDHKSDNSEFDELRVFNKALSQAEIQLMINSFHPYVPQYAGETFYMPFDGSYINLVGSTTATEVGMPGFTSDSYEGSGAYLGATDSYITHPAGNLLTSQFSATFWYKVDASPDRAGIIVVGDDAADRFQGFRLFREGSATQQRIKLNVGTGAGESWNDGGVIDVTAGEWVHVAMTISNSETKIYLNGAQVNSATMSGPIDWTGCEQFVIGSGGDTFSYWDHKSDNSSIDELRFFNKELSADEVIAIVGGAYTPPYFGATMYMPFDGSNLDKLSNSNATVVGTTGFAGESKVGTNSYAGTTDSYLTFPTAGLLGSEFSAAMWVKLNAVPDRAGILVIGPEDTGNANYPTVQNNRTSGFRFFREDAGGKQRFKLNVGNGTADTWVDGGTAADVAANAGWVHLAFTISATKAIVYINGVSVKESTITGVDWSGCDIMSIMSGVPRFTEWGHKSDLSYLDELYIFDKALTPEEIQAVMAN